MLSIALRTLQTVSAIRTFFLMMALHPEIQRKAQAEIDAVVGTQRLPTMQDKESLPYLNCIIKEVMRVATIVPLMPHSLDVDDVRMLLTIHPPSYSSEHAFPLLQVYDGYLIPKEAMVAVNMWYAMRDRKSVV